MTGEYRQRSPIQDMDIAREAILGQPGGHAERSIVESEAAPVSEMPTDADTPAATGGALDPSSGSHGEIKDASEAATVRADGRPVR